MSEIASDVPELIEITSDWARRTGSTGWACCNGESSDTHETVRFL
jgi:hypothetical protein